MVAKVAIGRAKHDAIAQRIEGCGMNTRNNFFRNAVGSLAVNALCWHKVGDWHHVVRMTAIGLVEPVAGKDRSCRSGAESRISKVVPIHMEFPNCQDRGRRAGIRRERWNIYFYKIVRRAGRGWILSIEVGGVLAPGNIPAYGD